METQPIFVETKDFSKIYDTKGRVTSATHLRSGRKFNGCEFKQIEKDRHAMLKSLALGSQGRPRRTAVA